MGKYNSNRGVLDRSKYQELVLSLTSFSGGENLIGEDHDLADNEARVIKNWEAISAGGMIRAKGFSLIASDGAGALAYTDDFDSLAHHYESASSTALYGIVNTDLVILSGSDINQEDAAAFTAGVLSHAVVAGDTLYITNSTDNLQYKTIGAGIATPTQVPSAAKDRIYFFKERLVAEGGNKVVEGSKAGTGNWKADAGAWTDSNDAWSATLPDLTQGCAQSFPTGNEITVFTNFATFTLFNFPNVAIRPIQNSHGCSLPHTIALGSEGLYFASEFPTKGIYLWDTVRFINLTDKHDFVDNIDFSKRAFGIYRNNEYILTYNESGSGVTYPNRTMVFDARYGRWYQRPVNTDLSDNFGYPALLSRDNNELYYGSSQKTNIYEFEDSTSSDNANATEATYKTKEFTSKDFDIGTGGQFTIDDVRMKLVKATVVFAGQSGSLSLQWTADRGGRSGSLTYDLTAEGDIINENFTVNTSLIVTDPPDKTVTKTFGNAALGRSFNFQLLSSGTGTRPQVKRVKIHAVALEES